MRGFDARSSFELGFGHRERAWRPGKQLDDDCVGERSNVQYPQAATAACYSPTQQHPNAPKHMEKQDGFCCYTRLSHSSQNSATVARAARKFCMAASRSI